VSSSNIGRLILRSHQLISSNRPANKSLALAPARPRVSLICGRSVSSSRVPHSWHFHQDNTRVHTGHGTYTTWVAPVIAHEHFITETCWKLKAESLINMVLSEERILSNGEFDVATNESLDNEGSIAAEEFRNFSSRSPTSFLHSDDSMSPDNRNCEFSPTFLTSPDCEERKRNNSESFFENRPSKSRRRPVFSCEERTILKNLTYSMCRKTKTLEILSSIYKTLSESPWTTWPPPSPLHSSRRTSTITRIARAQSIWTKVVLQLGQLGQPGDKADLICFVTGPQCT